MISKALGFIGLPNVYYIWYGTWDQSPKDVLTYFGNHIGGSPYFNIHTTYYAVDKGSERDPVLNKVNFVAAYGSARSSAVV